MNGEDMKTLLDYVLGEDVRKNLLELIDKVWNEPTESVMALHSERQREGYKEIQNEVLNALDAFIKNDTDENDNMLHKAITKRTEYEKLNSIMGYSYYSGMWESHMIR